MSLLEQIGSKSKQASVVLAQLSTIEKNFALETISNLIIERQSEIIDANKKDISNSKSKNISESLIDRLILTKERILKISNSVKEIINLEDPIGEILSMWKRPNELQIGLQRVPLGVIGLIYESRPNVTIDASVLCLKAGNSIILRGGSDAINTNKKIVEIIRDALEKTKLPKDCVHLIEDTSHETVIDFMKLNEYVDVLIPRGGYSLIQSVVKNATIPVIETGVGNCHVYVDSTADLNMATSIIINAKTSRPGVCNALETLLIDEKIMNIFMPTILEKLFNLNVEIRGCKKTQQFNDKVIELTEDDLKTEFLDLILAVKVVAGLDEAIKHINTYGTKHSEAIITNDYNATRRFQNEVDAAAIYINASTRFTDGNEFGLGAEIGISTQKLHARGPLGLKELTTSKYIIYGNGQIC